MNPTSDLKPENSSQRNLTGADRLKAQAKSTAKRVIDLYFSAKVSALRAVGAVDFPIPPNHNLRTTSSTTIRHFYESGLTTFMPIATAATIFGVNLDERIEALDFGCGVGRQLLHLTRLFPNVQAHGCDVNEDAIGYLQRTFPKIQAHANSFDPPLQYGENTFDLIYSVSIFSHLSLRDAHLWLADLQRVAKSGAVLCLTFNGQTSLDCSHRTGKRLECSGQRLEEQGYWFDADESQFQSAKASEGVSAFGANMPGITRLYGEMFYSSTYARRLMNTAGLEVLCILPGLIDRMQDLCVIRKP